MAYSSINEQLSAPSSARHGESVNGPGAGVTPEHLAFLLASHPYLKEAQVVRGVGDLPLNVQRHLLREGLDLSEVKGVFSAGRSYIVSSNLGDPEEGIKTALHEVVGHAGVRALLGERFEPVMGQLYDSFPREHEVWQTTERRYGYLDTGTQAGRIAFAEELTAYMAETAPELGEFDMIKAEIRAQLREQFPALPIEEWEVHALLQRSRESLILRHGEPAEVEELKAKLSYRAGAVRALQEYDQEHGRGGPDPLSLALYQQGSRVLDGDGLPTRLYHGAGRDVSQINGMFWGSVDPALANDYAELRAESGMQSSVVPYYADIRRPFDGDPLAAVKTTNETPSGLTVGVFVEELIRQAGVDDALAETLRDQGRTLRVYGRIEESGPTYSPQDFWYQTYMVFGQEGAALLQEMFAAAGFDGIRYTEQGSVSYGAFSPAQLHFIDQGATLRGWQPDRGHGVGSDSQAAFNRWFGQSHAVDAEGKPLRLFHGTGSDFSSFHTGRGSIYTTPDTKIASVYAFEAEADVDELAGPNIMPLYLSLQNPLVLDEAWAVENLDQDGEREWTILDEVLYQAEQEGYDGAILRGMVDYSGMSEGDDGLRQRQVRAYDQYIAFRPEQVKSALTNVGSFDPTNPDIRYAIHAYHGSPHKFSRFDLSKVNSGEGNQTFGHGLYFASMEAVASAYLFAGKGTRMQLDGRSLLSRENTQAAKADPLLNRAVGYLAMARDAQLAVEMAVADERPEVADRVLDLLREGRITKITPGNLYEVVLSPNESDLLDWDAPIEEQSPTVLARLRDAGVSLEPDRETVTGKFTGKDLYQALVMRADEETFDRQGPLWDVVKDDPNRLTYSMDAIASRYLNAIGVPGLRYYDGDSRVSGGGSHNYVMFDDKLIEITDVRYKLDAALGKTSNPDDVVTISAFQRWFANSAVVDGDGKPLVVYHGTEKGGFTAFDTDGRGRTAGTGAFFTQTRLGASDYSGTDDDAVMFDRAEFLANPAQYGVTIEVHGDDDDREYIAFTDDHDGAGETREEALEALADSLEEAETPGVYPVYLSLKNPMIVDCHHSNWDEIITHWDIVDEDGETIDFIHDPAEIEPYLEANPHHTVEDGVTRTSNELAREAREMGFDGLIMLNVSDEGPHGQGYAWDDVIYVAFKPEQVKSIYNVGSYDPANEDIRYSLSPRASRATAEVPASSKQSAFESWFAASVVTDPQGQPLPVYHGSPDIRGIIQQGFQRSPTRGEVYFSDDYQVADTYADDSRAWDYQNAEPYTAPFYLSLQNPYVIDGAGQKWRETQRHIAEARALGHDGIIIRNSRDEYNHTGNGGKPSTVYAVFDPKKIGAAEPNQPLYSRVDRQPLGDLSVLDRAAEAEPPAVLPPLPDIPTLTVLHGTESEPFTRFERSSSNDGFFFTQANRLASGFAGNSGHIIEAHLDIQRPADLRGDPDAWEGFQQGGGLLRSLAIQGFDGAVYLEPAGDYADGTELVFVAFDQEQITVTGTYPVDTPRLSFAGESASTMDVVSLRNAKRAEAAGADPEVVRQVTGWFRGAEGRWRFEIDDSQAALKPQLAMLGHGRRGTIDMHKVEHKALGDGRYHISLTPVDASLPSDIVQLVNVDREALEQLLPVEVVNGIVEGRGEDIWGGQMPEAGLSFEYRFTHRPLQALALSEVLEHPALFQAYPVLNDVLVKVDPALGREARFGFEATGGPGRPFVITLGKHQQLSSLLHELQHCVQAIEGFAPGGSANDKTLPRQSDIIDRLTRETQERISAITTSPDYKAYLEREFEAAGKVVSRRTGQPVQARASDIRLAADERFGVTALREELKSRLSSLQSQGGFLNDRYTAYRCLAGEVEARNVESRLAMRAKERLAASPTQTQDVATRDQLVRSPLENGRAVASESRGLSGTQTETLMAWFNESKVVDANGAPLKVYHGTLGDHDSFDPDFIGSGNGLSDWGEGFYFASVPEAANGYAEGPGGNVRAVYLNIQNPANLDVMLSQEVQAALDDDMGFTTPQEVLAELGYDGIAIDHGNGVEYIVFSNEQIRSVFDPEFFSPRPYLELGSSQKVGDKDASPRYSFAGESARTAPRMQLVNAQRAIQAGIDPEVVRQETGWFQGAEGRWRFEIDDSEASVRYGQSTSSNPDAYIDWSDEAEHRERGVRLSTVLDHPALFEAYPQLSAYRVQVLSPQALSGAVACFDREARAIKMVDPYSLKLEKEGVDPVLSVLLHEIQHAVQDIEGFSPGGNVMQIRREAGVHAMHIPSRKVIEDAEYIVARWEQGGFKSIDDFVGYIPCANFDVWQDASIALAKSPERLAEARRKLDAYDDAPSRYRRLAGEVEARNVEARQGMNASDRKEIAPSKTMDVAENEQVITQQPEKVAAATGPGMPLALQRIDTGEGLVANETQVGEQLQSSADSIQASLVRHGLDAGWQDGGCRIFVDALSEWSGGRIQKAVTRNSYGVVSHAVGLLPLPEGQEFILLDSDGVATEQEVILKLQQLEHSAGERLAEVGPEAEAALHELPSHEGLSRRTAYLLRISLGEYEEWEQRVVQEVLPLVTVKPSPSVGLATPSDVINHRRQGIPSMTL